MAIFGMLKAKGLPDGVKSPRDVAEKLVAAIKKEDAKLCENVEVAGAGFINMRLSTAWLSSRVHSFVLNGVLPPPGPKQTVVVDFSSPNVAKEMHVGHLRSTIIGDCICRVLEFCGHDVDRVNHVGDWGTQFGMLISYLKDVFPDYATRPPPIKDLQEFYKAAKKVFDNDEAFKKRAHEEVVRLQSGDGPARFAWQQICDVSRREFEKVYSRLDVTLAEKGESYYNEYIPPVIKHCDEIGLITLKEEKDPATNLPTGRMAKVIFPPKAKHEHPLIVQKSDGGFGYDSTDVTAVWYRLLDQRADWVIYVTDAGQGPHFDLVFDTARAAGWADGKRLDHTPFGVVQRINHCVTATFGPGADGGLFAAAAAAGSDDGVASHAAGAALVAKLEKELNAKGLAVSGKKMLTEPKKQVKVAAADGDAAKGGTIELQDLGNAENAAAAIEYLQALGGAGAGALSGLGAAPSKVEPSDKVEKFKTRAGDTVRLVDLLDEAVSRMEKSFAEKEAEDAAKGLVSKGKLTVAERAGAAKVMGYAAVKYADLKGNRTSNYVFSYDRMLDKNGNTAVYLLYASARISSILRTAREEHGVSIDALLAEGVCVTLVHEAELALGKHMLKFQEAVVETLDKLMPSTLCEYVYELTKLTSKFLLGCRVMGDPAMKQRLLLLAALDKVLRKGYALIGLGYLEKI